MRCRTVLYLNYGSIALMHGRNAVGDILSGVLSDRGGAFDDVIVILFPTGQRSQLRLSPRHRVIEFDVPEVAWFDRLGLHIVGTVIRWLAYLLFALSTMRRERVALIEATEPFFLGPSALILSRLTGVPYSVQATRHYDLDHEMLGVVPGGAVYRTRPLSKAIERLVWRNADVLFADRRFYAEYGIANGADRTKLILGRVVADPAYYSDPTTRPDVRARYAPGGERIVLYVGRISADKHVSGLVHLLEWLRQHGQDVVLVMAGNGPLEAELGALAAELGVSDRLRIARALPLDTLPALMSSADVIVGPHMGFTLVEAALSGTPIVAYDWEWHDEVIEHGRTGILVPFGDWGAMAREVAALLDDRERAVTLGRAARAFALAHHDRDTVRAGYREAFDRFFDRRARDRAERAQR